MSSATSPDSSAVLGTPTPSGVGGWIGGYALMLRWEFATLRAVIPIMIVAQVFMGGGIVLGFGLLFDSVPPLQALYLSTGASVVSLLIIGIGLAPQLVAQQKVRNTYDFLWSLPVPRLAQVLANLTVWVAATLPGMVFALTVAVIRYDVDLEVSVLVVPAALLTVLVATSLGYGMGHAIPNPQVTALVSQVLTFVVFLYSPINFPADRLPQWLQVLHHVLPFEHAATVMRAGLTSSLGDGTAASFATLLGWTIAGWVMTWWVVGRRH